ncbi:MAG TPA: SLBB domain-containing protein [Pyrinomonadaceae bacterium]|nr:SLBB domain-containing protein [Pyrinomonadaceae bacterium]
MMKNVLLILSLLIITGASCLTARAQGTGSGGMAVVERVYVTGSVARPQEVLFSKGLTLTRALYWAGGLSADADTKRVKISRDNGTKEGDIFFVNLRAIQGGKETDFQLRPFDVVCVPNKKAKGMNCNALVMRRPQRELPSRVIY